MYIQIWYVTVFSFWILIVNYFPPIYLIYRIWLFQIFEDVVDVLDPEMNLASDEENDGIDNETESRISRQTKSRLSQISEAE